MQTAKRTSSLEGFLGAFGGRLKAMASANELLTAARWRGAAALFSDIRELNHHAQHLLAWIAGDDPVV